MLFAYPSEEKSSAIVLLPVPWEVTTSYGSGTSEGPAAILEASAQVDLFDLELGESYQQGYFLQPLSSNFFKTLKKSNDHMKPIAERLRHKQEQQLPLDSEDRADLQRINGACADMVAAVHQSASAILERGQIAAVIGGDHSSPEGLIQAVSEKYQGEFGILHLDAHADLRQSYQGFERSHASIMYNVMHANWRPSHLVQVGIRDFCLEEYQLTRSVNGLKTFFDADLKRALMEGESWAQLCRQMIEALPKKVYLSFDIDGLSPDLCPNTGTPVPGGLSFEQVNYLLCSLVKSGRQIVGFDLNEVAPGDEGDQWDGNVGARLLYKMCGWTVLSQK